MLSHREPGGCRLIILAAVGWLVLGAQQPTVHAQSEQSKPSQHLSHTKVSARLERGGENADTPPKSRPCDPGDDRRDSDLCAQWKAADAAKDAAWWAAVAGWLAIPSLILSGIGVIAVVYALRQTDRSLRIAQREAARSSRRAIGASEDTIAALKIAELNAVAAAKGAVQAKRSAEIAKAGLKVARDTAKHQLRAYIGIEEGGIHSDQSGKSVQIILKNFGSTPAYQFKAGIVVVFRPTDHEIGIEGPAEGITATNIAPGQGHMMSAAITMTDNEQYGLARNQLAIFALIACDFTDIFGERSSVKICLRWTNEGFEPYPYIDLR